MPVRYHGPDGVEELIPAPLVDINKTYIRDEGTLKLRPEYVFTLTGTIVNIDTSLDSPAAQDFVNMEGVLAEQKRIRRLFSGDGGRLEIETPGGGGPNTIDAYCTVESINFSNGTWVNRGSYTVVLRSSLVETDGEAAENLSSRNETWNITENEDGTYGISHNLSATGFLTYGPDGANDPLQEAKEWCRLRSYSLSTTGDMSVVTGGTDSLNMTQIINPLLSDSDNFWNRSTVETVGPTAYSWQLSENFIYNPNGNYKEDFSASVSYEQNDPRRITVTANGNVVGFADKNSNYALKISNAKSAFGLSVEPNIYTRLTTYVPSGYVLNPVFTVKQVSYEELAGAVRYSCSFSAVSGLLITDAIDESINVHDTGSTDVFAQIQVPGRQNGPVVQYMNTKTLPERIVSISATMAPSTSTMSVSSLASLYSAKPNTDAIINALKPSAGYYYVRSNDEEWNPIKRQYSRQVSWVLQPEGQTVLGVPSGVNNTSAG